MTFTATKTFCRDVEGHKELMNISAPSLGQKAILRIEYSEVAEKIVELFGRKSPRFFFCNKANQEETVEVTSRESYADCLLMPEGTGSTVTPFAGANGTTLLSVSDARQAEYIVY